jgi:hypothetical protein
MKTRQVGCTSEQSIYSLLFTASTFNAKIILVKNILSLRLIVRSSSDAMTIFILNYVVPKREIKAEYFSKHFYKKSKKIFPMLKHIFFSLSLALWANDLEC